MSARSISITCPVSQVYHAIQGPLVEMSDFHSSLDTPCDDYQILLPIVSTFCKIWALMAYWKPLIMFLLTSCVTFRCMVTHAILDIFHQAWAVIR